MRFFFEFRSDNFEKSTPTPYATSQEKYDRALVVIAKQHLYKSLLLKNPLLGAAEAISHVFLHKKRAMLPPLCL
jgi:hypothetical protein